MYLTVFTDMLPRRTVFCQHLNCILAVFDWDFINFIFMLHFLTQRLE